MADAPLLSRLVAVGTLRRRRLEREAAEAREVAEQARRAAERAAASHRRAIETARSAQAMFASDPICAQARFWRDLSRARRTERAEAACDARDREVAADEARKQAIAVVLRHERKQEALVDFTKAARRADERVAESRADDGDQKRKVRS